MHLCRLAIAVSWALVAANAGAAEVCTVLADADSGAALVQRGDCTTRVTPASTFKIAISLMGYDAGFLEDAHTPELPFKAGYVDWRANWKYPADPARWLRDSVVWYSQQVTQALGAPRFAAYTRRFEYGNADVTGDAEHAGLTLSWIDSSLRISPLEQTAFLTRLVKRRLGVSAHAYDMTAVITAYGPVAGWDVHGKTGAAGGYGWYVGWAVQGARTLVFAHLIHDDATEPQAVPAGERARAGFIAGFPHLLSETTR